VTIADSTKALLAVVVPFLTTLALGVALILAFGQESGGAPASKPAAISPPSVPAVSAVATPVASHLCGPRQLSASSIPPGSGLITVTPDPASLIAIWSPGLDAGACLDEITRGGRVLSAELAATLDDEPAIGKGIYACPLENGSSVVMYFGYGKGHPLEFVTVALSGCRFISDPGLESRWWLQPGSARSSFGQILATLAPSPWHASILAALRAD
jgi:hypothetical protein